MEEGKKEINGRFLKVVNIHVNCVCLDERYEGEKYIFSFFESDRFLSSLEYVWIRDDQFRPEMKHLGPLMEEKKDLLVDFGYGSDCLNLEIFYPLVDDRWIIYLNRKDSRAIGVSRKQCYSDLFRRVFSLGYLKASCSATSFCLLLHSAGIVVDEHCFIFPALSGMGKTTISMRAAESGFPVLSDEYIVVTKHNNTFMAHPTPFGEVGNETKPYPISGIVMLCKDKKNQIRAFPWLEGFLRTWNGEFYYRSYYTHGNFAEKLFSQLIDLYKSVPCFYLNFRKSFDEWHLLLDAVSGAPLERFSIFELKNVHSIKKN